MSTNNKKLTLKKNTDNQNSFALLINELKQELIHECDVVRPLHHLTNKNGISLNLIRVHKCHHEDNHMYVVYFHKKRKTGEFNEFDSDSDSDNDDDFLFTECSRDADLGKAFEQAYENVHQWDQCEGCDVYTKNLIQKKCTSCILNTHIIENTSDDDLFECVICKTKKFNVQKVTLKCKHDCFCCDCINHLKELVCPLCRAKM